MNSMKSSEDHLGVAPGLHLKLLAQVQHPRGDDAVHFEGNKIIDFQQNVSLAVHPALVSGAALLLGAHLRVVPHHLVAEVSDGQFFAHTANLLFGHLVRISAVAVQERQQSSMLLLRQKSFPIIFYGDIFFLKIRFHENSTT